MMDHWIIMDYFAIQPAIEFKIPDYLNNHQIH